MDLKKDKIFISGQDLNFLVLSKIKQSSDQLSVEIVGLIDENEEGFSADITADEIEDLKDFINSINRHIKFLGEIQSGYVEGQLEFENLSVQL